MIQGIADMSQVHDQATIDDRVVVDVDASGCIVGIDFSGLVGLASPGSFCIGTRVPLGMLKKKHWFTMKFKKA
jgi:hypothetical protein